jgi:putative transposase
VPVGLRKWAHKANERSTGFGQPLQLHEHWHIDIAHINIHGPFYYVCAVLDGASRYLVDWSLRDAMKETDVDIPLERAKGRFPEARRGSSPTTGHSSSRRTSRSSFGSRG